MRVDPFILEHLFDLFGLDALDGLASTCGPSALDLPPSLVKKVILSPSYDAVKLGRVLDLSAVQIDALVQSVRSAAQGG